jgi:16S rRNA (guanine(966)-N(2))-methyltransferase RsmD
MDTRPTADRLRETLFNVLTNGAVDRVAGGVFLDLYAGSGAVGIEAVSRGASRTIFVEQGAPALAILQKNLSNLGIRGPAIQIEKKSVARYLRGALANATKEKIGVVFLDPPYEDATEYEHTLSLLGGECAELLAPDAIVIAEHRKKSPLAENYGRLEQTRVLKQGDAGLSFYQLREETTSAEEN